MGWEEAAAALELTLCGSYSYSNYKQKRWGGLSLKESGIVFWKVLTLSPSLSAFEGITMIKSAAQEDPTYSAEVSLFSSC